MVMSSTLRTALLIGSVIFFIFIINMVRTKRLELKYALIWIISGLGFIIMSAFPEIMQMLARLIGVEVTSNALFLCIIFLLLLMVFALTVAVSRQASRTKHLVQKVGLLKAEIEENKHDYEQLH